MFLQKKKAKKKKATHTHSSLSKRLIGQNKAPSYTPRSFDNAYITVSENDTP